MNCPNCNKALPNGSSFCSNCGFKINIQDYQQNEIRNDFSTSKKNEENSFNQANNQQAYSSHIYQDKSEEKKREVIRKISEYEKTSGTIWIVIGILQCLSVVGIFCGIWNIIIGVQRSKYSKEISIYSTGIVETFEGQLTSLIIFLVINIFFGAVIGVIGAVFDMFVRNYVLENRAIIDTYDFPEPKPAQSGNNINDIKSLKELLDMGAITQEEFDVKKKELLGL